MKCTYQIYKVHSFVFLVLVLQLAGLSETKIISPNIQHNKWQRMEIMDGNGLYLMEWTIDNNNKDIIFTITVNTRGYIGIGFSHKSGKMANSDLILAWIDDRTGKANILVCFLFHIQRDIHYLCSEIFVEKIKRFNKYF